MSMNRFVMLSVMKNFNKGHAQLKVFEKRLIKKERFNLSFLIF